MDVFVIGAPYTGKTTFVNLLTGGKGVGSFKFEDERLKELVEIFKPPRIIPPSITLHDSDLLGKLFVEDKAQRIFQELNGADAFIEISGGLSQNFTSFTDTTLRFLSIESLVLERNIIKLEKEVASGGADEKVLKVLKKAYEIVNSGVPLISGDFNDEEIKILKTYGFLSLKPRMVILNLYDGEVDDGVLEELESQKLPYMSLNILKETNERSDEIFRKILEITNHIVFFTPSEKEVRGWLLKKGSSIVEAAAKIHSDLAKTFVKAEVINWKDLVSSGGWKEAKEKNLVKLQGKSYIVNDGDCIYIRASAVKSRA